MTSTSSGDNLGGRAVRGAVATLGGQGVRIAVLLASTFLLARILSPSDFGLMSIVLSIVAFGELFRDFGLSTASARETNLSQGQKSNLFWVNSSFGFVLSIICFFIAVPVANVYGEPDLVVAIQWTSVIFLLNGLATQFRAELNRQLRFLALSAVDTIPAILGLAAALLYATVDSSFTVLVVQQLVIGVSGLIIAIVLVRWLPGLPKRTASISALFKFSAGLFGTQVVAYFTKNIDNLTLGYFWGTGPLGLYSRAYQILMMPLNQVAAPLTRVMVPVLTRVADDNERFERFLLKSQVVGGVGLGVLYGFCIGLADPLVAIVFGPNWTSMVPIFQILAIGGVFRALNQMSFWIFLSRGMAGAQFRFYLVSQPIIIAFILAGLPWGAVGVAIGHSIGYALNWVISLWWCGRKTSTRVRPLFVSGVFNILLFALPAALLGAAANQLIQLDILAVLTAFVAFVIYVAVAYFVSKHVRNSVKELLSVVKRVRKRGK